MNHLQETTHCGSNAHVTDDVTRDLICLSGLFYCLTVIAVCLLFKNKKAMLSQGNRAMPL